MWRLRGDLAPAGEEGRRLDDAIALVDELRGAKDRVRTRIRERFPQIDLEAGSQAIWERLTKANE